MAIEIKVQWHGKDEDFEKAVAFVKYDRID